MTFVLVPGAGGDGFYWHLLAPLLGPDTVADAATSEVGEARRGS